MRSKKKLDEVLSFLKTAYHVEPEDVLQLIKTQEKQEKEEQACFIPVSLFSAVPVSSLEAITLYLREEKHMTFTAMALLLGRNQIALSTTYRNARKKYAFQLKISESQWHIPAVLFRNRTLSVLEVIVLYLKKDCHMQNSTIAVVLKKDPRTIWTVLQRIQKKGVRL
jgi:hypothetical protein